MIWLDGLDLPSFQHFPVHFVQHYAQPRYPAQDAPKSNILFPWKDMQARLDANLAEPYARARYTSQNPGEEGQEVSKAIGAQCERIRAGHSSPRVQETASAVYHVVDGKGSSKIGDKVIEWKKGDTFSLPAWQAYEHQVGPLCV
jgi:gentisate 1,2-dioxygenase